MDGDNEKDQTIARINCLPIEYTVWTVNQSDDFQVDDSDSDDDTPVEPRLLTVVDARGLTIGASMKDACSVSLLDHTMQLLEDCMVLPLSGKPRRPRWVHISDSVGQGEQLPLEKYSIDVVAHKPAVFRPLDGAVIRACSFCRKRGSPQLFYTCVNCESVFYCSERCESEGNAESLGAHRHVHWCAIMKTYRNCSSTLADLPFTFVKETTSADFDQWKYKDFLEKQCHFLGEGFINRECPDCLMGHLALPKFGELCEDDLLSNLLSLPPSHSLDGSTAKPPSPSSSLTSWEEYYNWRGLPLDSPLALLLHFPLTVYHILMSHFHSDRSPGDTCTIHILGVEKEVEILPVFLELGLLIPGTKFDIHMFGPSLSKKVEGKTCEGNSVTITVCRGVYHSKKLKEQAPDLVIGLNAGLAAYSSWSDTLKKLKAQKTPAYFTDYCQYSCECAKAPMQGLHLGTISEISINLFRCPVRKYCEEHDMPWYSNGFIYHLVYNESS